MQRLGASNPVQSKICIWLYSQPSVYMLLSYPRFWLEDSTTHRSCGTVVFTVGKIWEQVDPHSSNPCCSRDSCVENSTWIMSCECEELLWVAACLVHVGVSARWLSDQSTQGKGKGLWAGKPWPQTRLLPQHLCLWYSNKAAHISLTWLIRKRPFLLIFQLRLFQGGGEKWGYA